MSDQREVGEMSLDVWIQDGLRPSVAQRRPVLVQQIHQLLGDDLGRHQQVLPPELLHGVAVGPGHVVSDGARGELCLTNITKVSSEMNGLA